MVIRFIFLLLTVMTVATNLSATIPLDWGDQGNGTYRNPVINADYSDPDVIRVGEKYYMVASDFHFMGMQILESLDMVNWRIVTQVYNRFDMPKWDTNERYAGGSWAPALRYHDGKYWIFFCTPHEGLFMTQAERPEGPWSPLPEGCGEMGRPMPFLGQRRQGLPRAQPARCRTDNTAPHEQ